ncbi:MAG: bacillithiol biosynthesis cysteine-adding enzyme BshC [Actinobacteria bacterium]|nr:bacillithiol biosynthesis cysteine-adding enzyme BshC [Actinomycetota bacterium]
MITIKNTINENFYYNKLYYDYIFNFNKLKDFYSYDYRLKESYSRRIKYVGNSYNNKFREIIFNELLEYNMSISCGANTLKHINMLKDENTFAVIAGQQPAIFTGPVFVIYKVITLLNIAGYLKNNFNLNVVPMFWNASDDNDLPEIKSIKISDSQMEKISIDIPEYLSGFSYSKIILPVDEYEEATRKLTDSLAESDFKREIAEFLNNIISLLKTGKKSSGISISKFYSMILSKLFDKYGLVIIDPEIPGIKRLAMELISFDLNKFNEINGIVEFTGRELENERYHRQLKLAKGNLDFFLNTENGREKIKYSTENTFTFEKSFKIRKNKLDKNALTDIIFKNISNVSLNVVLRPLFQDYVLPNIITVCGPGEISYYAQLKDVYTLYGIEPPILYPRMSAAIVEKKVQKAMSKINISYDDMDSSQDVMANKILKNLIGFDYQKFLQNLEINLSELLQDYMKELSEKGIEAEDAFGRIKQNLKKETQILGKRIISEYKKKNSFIVEALSKIYNNLLPAGKMQEREINIFEYINRYGFELIDKINTNFKTFDFFHKLIEIN